MSINPDNQDPQDDEREGTEFLSIIDGKKTDRHLHEPILEAVDRVDINKLERQNARNLGFTEEQIVAVFGPPLTD